MIVELKNPIHCGPNTYSKLELREVQARDLVAIERVEKRGGGDIEQTLSLVASLAGIPAEAAEQLSPDDLRELGDKAADLLGKAQEAGESAS